MLAFEVWMSRNAAPEASIESRFLGRLARFQCPPSFISSQAISPSVPWSMIRGTEGMAASASRACRSRRSREETGYTFTIVLTSSSMTRKTLLAPEDSSLTNAFG